MQIRIECTLPELAGNWVDLSDVWTRREASDFYAAAIAGNDAVTFPLLQRKLTAVHLHLADGTPVTDVAMLFERFDDLDVRLARWLATNIMDALQRMLAMGEAQRRLLFDGVEIAARTKTQTPSAT